MMTRDFAWLHVCLRFPGLSGSNHVGDWLAAAVGLALSVGGALLIDFLDRTLKTPEDVKTEGLWHSEPLAWFRCALSATACSTL
jgi:hypothetical protein